MTGDRPSRLLIASVAALLLAIALAWLSGPGKQAVSGDPRAALCGSNCYPASHPWLLIVAAALAVASLIGLRNAFKSNRR